MSAFASGHGLGPFEIGIDRLTGTITGGSPAVIDVALQQRRPFGAQSQRTDGIAPESQADHRRELKSGFEQLGRFKSSPSGHGMAMIVMQN